MGHVNARSVDINRSQSQLAIKQRGTTSLLEEEDESSIISYVGEARANVVDRNPYIRVGGLLVMHGSKSGHGTVRCRRQ